MISRILLSALLLTFALEGRLFALERGVVSLLGHANPGTANAFYTGISVGGNLAAVGSFMGGFGVQPNGVAIYDVSNRKNPQFKMNWKPSTVDAQGNSPGTCNNKCQLPEGVMASNMDFSEAIKVYKGFGFFSGNMGGGCYIVNLTNASDINTWKVAAHIIDFPDEDFPGVPINLAAHDLEVEMINGRDYLFLAGLVTHANQLEGGQAYLNDVRIYDVTDVVSGDPDSEPVYVSTIEVPQPPHFGLSWVHAVRPYRRVVNGVEKVYLFGSLPWWHKNSTEGAPGQPDRTVLYDISNPAAPVVVTGMPATTGNGSHSVSLSRDGKYMYNNLEAHYNSGSVCPHPLNPSDFNPSNPCEQLIPTMEIYELTWNSTGTAITNVVQHPNLDHAKLGMDVRRTSHFSVVRGNYLYVTWYSEGLLVFDISGSNGANPKLIGSYDTYEDDPTLFHPSMKELANYHGAYEVDVTQDGSIFVSDSRSGLFVLSMNQAYKLTFGTRHSVGVKPDGSMWAWGYNGVGQFGNGATSSNIVSTPQRIGSAADTSWVRVSAGVDFSVGLKKNGTIWAWGSNKYGQLGINSPGDAFRASPVQISSTSPGSANNDWVSVSAGQLHAMAVKSDGRLFAWGRNDLGQVGNGITSGPIYQPTRVYFSENPAPVIYSASGGGDHSLAMAQGFYPWLSGIPPAPWGFGYNATGQLGLGYNSPMEATARKANPVYGFNQLQAGYDFSGGINMNFPSASTSRNLYSWGDNNFWQLGTQSVSSSNVPIPQFGLSWTATALGTAHTVAVKLDGSLYGFGLNNAGQLGNNSTQNSAAPVREFTQATDWVTPYASASSATSFALKNDGSVYGFGWNGDGNLGLGNTNQIVQTPTLSKFSPNYVTGSSTTLGSTATVNLYNSDGFQDYVHWNTTTASASPRKPDVLVRINNWTILGTGGTTGTVSTSQGFNRSSFTGVTQSTIDGVRRSGATGTGNGFQLTVVASSQPSELLVHVGVNQAKGRLEASLDDNGTVVPIYTDNTLTNTTGASYRSYRIKFASLKQGGGLLKVKWILETNHNGSTGQVRLMAASLK